MCLRYYYFYRRNSLRPKLFVICSFFTSTFSATVAAVATMTTAMATAVATLVAFLWNCFRLQWLQFKLGNFALTAAWPHARPLAKTFLWWLLAALTTWIVNTRPKGDWECHRVATTTSAAATVTAAATTVVTNFRTAKTTATIAASTKSTTSSCHGKKGSRLFIFLPVICVKVGKERKEKFISRPASYKELPSLIKLIVESPTLSVL